MKRRLFTILMKSGISKSLFVLLSLGYASLSYAQADSARYDRPSLCLMMIARPDMAYSSEIEEVFRQMDMPERFNNHGLGVRVFKVPQDGKAATVAIESFARHAEVAKKMISKWFCRDKATGCFNTSLLQERGMYNTTIPDVTVAMHTIRGKALLEDAGEKLVGHTFLVVNEFKYEKHFSATKVKSDSQKNVRGQIDLSNQADLDAFNENVHGGDLLRDFAISCTSYLYQLVWNEEVAGTFYNSYYAPYGSPDAQKSQAFLQDKETFRLEYIGSNTDKLSERNTQKLSTPKLVKKVCVRIVDKNIACLQHQFPQFRIKALLMAGNEEAPFKAYVGLKEDITPDSRFEVLEPELHEDGTYTYKRVGVIKPLPNKIWDNRYMATDDQPAELDATYFELVSGNDLYPGLVIREM